MMTAITPLRLTVVAVCVFSSLNIPILSRGRQTKPPGRKKTDTQATTSKNEIVLLRSKAATIVSEIYDDIPSVTPRHLRVALKAKTADAMWDFDEPRGRRIMKEAVSDMYVYLRELTAALKDSRTPQTMGYSPVIGEVAAIVARRDSQLAKEIFSEAVKISSAGFSENSQDPNQASGKSILAFRMAEANPKLAAEIGEASVESQVDPNIVALIVKLRETDPEAARRLFAKALEATMRSPDWAVVLMSLAMFALPEWGQNRYDVGLMGNAGDEQSASLVLAAVCNESTRQNHIPIQKNASTDQRALRSFYVTTALTLMMLPYFERQMPQCADQVRMRANSLLEAMPDATTRERMAMSTTRRSTEQLLSEASGMQDKKQQDQAYSRAMMAALEKSDWNEAFRIVEMFNDERVRASNRSFVSIRAAFSSLEKKDIDKALSYSEQVTSLDDVAQIYSRAATLLIEKKDNLGAISLLRSGRDRIERAGEQPNAGDALLVLASTMANADTTNAFELAASGIGILNKRLIEVKDLPNNVARARWVYSRRLEGTMLNLANSDFEESLRVAKLVEDKLTAMNCRLAICRALLDKTKQRTQ